MASTLFSMIDTGVTTNVDAFLCALFWNGLSVLSCFSVLGSRGWYSCNEESTSSVPFDSSWREVGLLITGSSE